MYNCPAGRLHDDHVNIPINSASGPTQLFIRCAKGVGLSMDVAIIEIDWGGQLVRRINRGWHMHGCNGWIVHP